MTPPFTLLADSVPLDSITDALLAPDAGIQIVQGSISLVRSGPGAVSFYDGSLSPLGIGAGLLLTSGTVPGTANTVGWFGADNTAFSGFQNGSASIDAVVNTVFHTRSYDATTLSFDFTVSDPAARSISFDLVFGSEEYPEWVDLFVDSAIVRVNGVNYALFNNDPRSPLSVVGSNLAAGYFLDNGTRALPIEYDGVSRVLRIVAPIDASGVNHIEIGIADTGDHIYDSGLFIANLTAGTTAGSGVVVAPPSGTCTEGDDLLTGSSRSEYWSLLGGNDTVYAGAGNDIVEGGAGDDSIFGGSGDDSISGGAGDDVLDGGLGSDTAVYSGNRSAYVITHDEVNSRYTVSGPGTEGNDILVGFERIAFADGQYTLLPTGTSLVTDGTGAGPGTGPAPNSTGSMAITGLGSIGQVLTANLSDADGVAGGVSIQWQRSVDLSTWTDIAGATGVTYTVANADGGGQLRATATYTDAKGHAEAVISGNRSIENAETGDQVVTLMQIIAPSGAIVATPLTTLVSGGIALGLTPNLAMLAVKSALALPEDVHLANYDAWSVLAVDPTDPVALHVQRVAVQVAVLTALNDDDTGTALTLKLIEAASIGRVLDLANAVDLAWILGVEANPSTGTYPALHAQILSFTQPMADVLAEGTGSAGLAAQWIDLLNVQDGIQSGSIADLSHAINVGPSGSSAAVLGSALQGHTHTIARADLLAGFQDANGDALEVTDLVADSGTLTLGLGGNWLYTPPPGYSGPVELVYTVSDGQGGTASGSLLLVVAPQTGTGTNTAPTGSVTVTGTAEQGATLTATHDLADADGLGTIAWQWLADGLPIAGATGATFTATQAEVGRALTAVASWTDGLGWIERVESSPTAAVTDINDAPVIVNPIADQGAKEASVFSFAVPGDTFADPDGAGTLTWSASRDDGSALPAWLSFNAITRRFSGTPGEADAGTLTVRVTATDAGGLASSDSFDIVVDPLNHAPTAVQAIGSQTATEGTAFSLQVPATHFVDVDPGDTLWWSATDGSGSPLPGWLDFDAATKTFSGTPSAADLGTVSIRVVVTDSFGKSASDRFDLVVAPQNTAPYVDRGVDDELATEDDAFSVQLSARAFGDADAGDVPTLTATLADGSALPTWLSFAAGSGTFSGTPRNGDVGTITVRVTATDRAGEVAHDDFTITVGNVNDAPIVAQGIADQVAPEDSEFSFTVPEDAFVDVDIGDTLAWSAELSNRDPLPAWLSFDASTRTFSGTPGNAQVGTVNVRVTVTDGSLDSASDTFAIVVTNVNDAPTLANALVDRSVNEDAAVSFSVPANAFADMDAGDVLTWSATLADGSALPDWLSFNAQTRVFSGTPRNADVGAIGVRVTVTDSGQASASDDFVLTVLNVNDAPTIAQALPDASATQDLPFSWTLPEGAFVDVDAGDTLTVSARLPNGSALPAWLAFDAGTRTLSGTPGNAQVGTLTVRITATDAAGASGFDDIAIVVANVNDAPTLATALVDQVATETVAFTYAVPATAFADIDAGDVLTYSATLDGGAALPAWLAFDPVSRSFSGTPPSGSAAALTVRVTATDAAGASVSDAFALTVAAPAGVTLTGTAAANTLTGGAFGDTLYGLAGNDTLNGLAGNDTLDGGAGNDRMVGGVGDDTYVVDSTRDTVTEAVNAGFDTVQTALASLTLAANVEQLVYTGTGNHTGTGNALANVLVGGAGNDTLSGLAGADTMIGGLGNDTYVVDVLGDVVIESAGGGTDTVRTALTAYTLADQVENLAFTGTAAFTGTGNALGNVLTGAAGADTLRGLEGNDSLVGAAGIDTLDGGAGLDTLVGGAGADVLTGGADADVFRYAATGDSGTTATTRDRIVDFMPGVDRIDLSAIDANTGTTGNQAFTWRGTLAISGAGQLAMTYDTASNTTVISGNVNAALAPEFTIALVGNLTTTLTAADFVL